MHDSGIETRVGGSLQGSLSRSDADSVAKNVQRNKKQNFTRNAQANSIEFKGGHQNAKNNDINGSAY